MATIICTACGKELDGSAKFCTFCGTKLTPAAPAEETVNAVVMNETPAAPDPEPVTDPSPSDTPNHETFENHIPFGGPVPRFNEHLDPPREPRLDYRPDPLKGTEHEHISTWGFVGIVLLTSIPIIGIILTIIWACGGCRKVEKQSYARAALICAAIYIVLTIIALFALGIFMFNIYETLDEIYGEDNWGSEEVEAYFSYKFYEKNGCITNQFKSLGYAA